MNRNAESHFALAPRVNAPRSKFSRPFNHKTTFNLGRLIPFYWTEVIPGQSTKLVSHKVVRTQPLVSAPMDNLYLDTYFFFVPNRLVWSHWKEFMGENTTAPWVQTGSYQVPQLYLQGGSNVKINTGTLPDYFGIPTNVIGSGSKLEFNALPFRAYALIVREFFQDENIETPVNVPTTDTDTSCTGQQGIATLDNNYVNYMYRGGAPYIVNKYHDYFTSCLPAPVKSPTDILAVPNGIVAPLNDADWTFDELKAIYGGTLPAAAKGTYASLSDLRSNGDSASKGVLVADNNSGDVTFEPATYDPLFPTNLAAYTNVSISDLRTAFQLQRLLERDAYSGTRYIEILLGHFGVHSPDASLQRPQYLGGKRTMINFNSVVQTSATSTTSPQGNIAGYSLTADSEFDFDSSFTEHGFIIGLCCVRNKNTYSQGLNRMMSRKTRYDYYWPELANISNIAVLKKELYADGSANDNDVFGYQEAWAEYRYHPDMVTGEMRPGISNTLASWHFGDYYSQAPTLSRSWLQADKSNLDRSLAIQSSVSMQLFAEFQFEEISTLPMPVYSIPGLIDHM